MKVDIYDAHDRYVDFTKKDFSISECVQDFLNRRPFGKHPFYLFAHSRTGDEGSPTRLIWQPRLSRPAPQTNSMLFKAYPGTDLVKIIWMIPSREMWPEYKKGNVTASEDVLRSIHDFVNNRELLDAPEPDDLTDQQIASIYVELSADARRNKLMNALWEPRPKI